MNYGMRCHDICPQADMDTVLDGVRDNGILQIQLAMGKSFSQFDFNPGHYSPGFAHMIGDKLKARGIHVAVLGCYINPVHPDENQRQAEVLKFIEHLKYARILGADLVGTETGRFDAAMKVTAQTHTEDCYRRLLKSMREIVSAAEKLGVIVGVEGVHDHTLNSPEIMKRFLEDIDSPNVEVILDPVNLIGARDVERQDQVIDQAFALYGHKITMLHIKDFILTEDGPGFAAVGEGLFHYENLMRHLKKEKPYITMLLEESRPERCHKDIEFLQRIYQQV